MIRIGVICPSEIAYRRFMPAVSLLNNFDFVGVGVFTEDERFEGVSKDQVNVESILQEEYDKATRFIDEFGGKIFKGYESIISSNEIDAVYIPLPPALHYKWAKRALENGKHVLVEKPSTTSAALTTTLVRIAEENNLALHENYMFAFHNQLEEIDRIIKSNEIGDVRLYRVTFGFPKRTENDFRYNKKLGGGALIDAGGYTIKYASMILGDSAEILYSTMNYVDEYEVDMYGSGAMMNDSCSTVQFAYGMDNNYKCELEVWGSKGTLSTGRVLTAPSGYEPEVIIRKGNIDKVRKLPPDNTFKKSIQNFEKCINDKATRISTYREIIKQSELVDRFMNLNERCK